MKIHTLIFALTLGAISLVAACDRKPAGTTDVANKTATGDRCPHEIKKEKCPFCNPGLVESEGFCGEHGVSEALCVQCRPYLKAAFRVKGDWCKEHDMPETQCVKCNPELKNKVKPGEHGAKAPEAGSATAAAQDCEHAVAKAKCPFCTPSIIEGDGFCKEHDIAEALCTKCRPYLVAAFKAKGDWCKEHEVPESQCVQCNPELKNKPKGKS